MNVTLGHTEVRVQPGLGYLGMSQFCGDAEPGTGMATIRAAIDIALTSSTRPTSTVRLRPPPVSPSGGFMHNEELLGRGVQGRRDEIVLSTHFGRSPLPKEGSCSTGLGLVKGRVR